MKEKTESRILVVDDDLVSRSIMQDILEPEGYTILAAADGTNLMDLLSDFRPDVLLMDVLMPGVNGFDLCRQVKSDQLWQHLPIILVTALKSDKELVAGLDAGADEFISKPVGAAELRARVRSMCRMKQRADMLLRNAQMREDLANMVAHDMRNPLAVCMMHVGIQRKLLTIHQDATDTQPLQGAKSSALNSLNIIHAQLDKLNMQIDDILLLAKTDRDEIVLNLQPADICELMHQVAADHELLAERERKTIRVEISSIACEQMLDTNLVSRMIENLVSNALKFSPTDSTITLRLVDEDNGRFCALEVIDEGLGIPIKEREHIFDRYAVASNNNKNIRSFGLGLAFCKMVAEAHGGHITVRDNLPRGTVFSVRFANKILNETRKD